MEKVLRDNGSFCTGCGACASVCPVSAINMELDDDGFIKAHINHNICVKCGRCESTCPVMHPDYANNTPICHAVEATDEERALSSSGGVFPVLAKSVLSQGGVVFGAAWNEDFSVSIKGVTDEDGLVALRSSKYVQSNTEQTFKEVAKHLRDGRKVLYSGCPCQIAGLKASLGERYSDKNLLTVEVVCHGAPPASVLRQRLDEEYGIENVKSVAFRDKKAFGWGVGEHIVMADGSVVDLRVSPYMDAFNPCLIMNRACGECKFAHVPRQADISLGDFWGIEKFRPDLLDHKGLSIVLVNSSRGQDALDGVTEQLKLDEVVPLEYATEINKTIIHPFPNHPGRKHFYLSRNLKSFRELTKSSFDHHYDVGIVGLWYGLNYGSVLTYYALYELIRSIGKDPVMLPKPNGMWEESYNDSDTLAQRFIQERCNVFLPYPSLTEYSFANNSCDMFVVGSDVVWSYEICGRASSQFFFLDWVRSDRKKIAYAASLGDSLGDNDRYITDAGRNLRKFSAISAREEVGVRQLEQMTGRDDIVCVMDPVFLCDKEIFSDIADTAEGQVAEEGGFFAYMLQGEMAIQKRHWMSLISKYLGAEKFIVGNASDYESARTIIGEEAVLGIPVENWLKSIRDSQFYFGDSYHGLCFALMFHVPFLIVYPDRAPAKSRMTNLLGLLGLTDRIVEDEQATDADVLAIVDTEIDWDQVDATIAREAEYSRQWLMDMITDECLEQPSMVADAHDELLERVEVQARNERMELNRVEEELGRQIRQLTEDVRAMQEHGTRQSQYLEDVLNSKSYRIGRAITWVPRKIRNRIRSRRA